MRRRQQGTDVLAPADARFALASYSALHPCPALQATLPLFRFPDEGAEGEGPGSSSPSAAASTTTTTGAGSSAESAPAALPAAPSSAGGEDNGGSVSDNEWVHVRVECAGDASSGRPVALVLLPSTATSPASEASAGSASASPRSQVAAGGGSSGDEQPAALAGSPGQAQLPAHGLPRKTSSWVERVLLPLPAAQHWLAHAHAGGGAGLALSVAAGGSLVAVAVAALAFGAPRCR